MDSQILLITGATRGLGKAALLELAKQGYTIVFVARKEEDGMKVRDEIIAKSANDRIDYILGDLMDLKSIHQLVDDFKAKHDHLDVLLQVAGANFGKSREVTVDGIEKTIALNLVAPYLLNILLLESLSKSNEARIVMTASVAYSLMAKPDFDDVELKENYTSNSAYGNSKLFLMLMAEQLVKKLKERGSNITVNTLHPGFVMNDKMRDFAFDKGFLGRAILYPLMKLITKTSEQGAESAIYLASSPDVKGKTGLYFSNSKPAKVNQKNFSDENRKAIWKYCEEITGIRID
ncbi:SDR family NAD(P)-dependent oxidoreductase [Sphingobacterium corticibacter]|uniref:Ketoreductase n=1 Tax=Sphingobacterium corticibacter TaxID=2171749 RepID=A0A2T8HK12_9SPHI|nr:SDR family NAD(P)-dependent oxidoreductase [Sphingobacterium corticibacter]PVH25784.1 ketoreductase [Sphingobacterium corticibacter]